MGIEWILGVIFFPLIIGSYGFTWLCYSMLRDELKDFRDNHLQHLLAQVQRLEDQIEVKRSPN